MASPSSALVNPLDDPGAVAVAGLLLVILNRLTALGLPLSALIAVVVALGLAQLRSGRRGRGERSCATVASPPASRRPCSGPPSWPSRLSG